MERIMHKINTGETNEIVSLEGLFGNPILNDSSLEESLKSIERLDFNKLCAIISKRFGHIVYMAAYSDKSFIFKNLFLKPIFLQALRYVIYNQELFEEVDLTCDKYALHVLLFNSFNTFYNDKGIKSFIIDFIKVYDAIEYNNIYYIYHSEDRTVKILFKKYSNKSVEVGIQDIMIDLSYMDLFEYNDEQKEKLLSCIYPLEDFNNVFLGLMIQPYLKDETGLRHENQVKILRYTMNMIEKLPVMQIKYILTSYVEAIKLYGYAMPKAFINIDIIINESTPNLLEAKTMLEYDGYSFVREGL